ncbi:hypothetical protein [Tropicimonas sp. IMCC34011]|uniref:hypothetical protein n=1 Tax=Tropicimonas sp. IMCC34011 TaxID=2248759 RepID=UPI0013009089|nr:hypothetical protein [Tropicimonas sp. IMCC34011]
MTLPDPIETQARRAADDFCGLLLASAICAAAACLLPTLIDDTPGEAPPAAGQED